MESPLIFAHSMVSARLAEGGLAVDATIGNGHDTLLLSKYALQSLEGEVLGFDVQEPALISTRQRLEKAQIDLSRVSLYQEGHENLEKRLAGRKPDVVMFNFGYLPGVNKVITTEAETSVSALSQACHSLAPSGLITVMCYTGHEEGVKEAAAVKSWAETLSDDSYRSLSYQYLNAPHDPPFLLLIERKVGS